MSGSIARMMLLSVVLLWAVDVAGAASSVRSVSFDRRSDGRGYVIRFRTTGTVPGYSEVRRAGANVLEVELLNVLLASSYERPRPAGPIVGYSEEARGGHLVFRFEMDPNVPVDAAVYRDRSSTDILVGLTYRGEPGQVLPNPAIPAVTVSLPAKNKSEASAEERRAEGEKWRLDTIVIDAGHGGRDVGAVANHVREKDICLSVAHKLGAYIEEHLGVNVLYTREDDRFIPLKDRGRFANTHEAKLFISIHVNSAGDSRASGTETYFLGLHKSEAAQSVMQRENEVVKLESDPDEYTQLNEQALIRQALLQSANMRKSEELASLVEQQFSQRVGRKSRGVKQAGFYVLWGASMPAILVELGFLTNPAEARFLASEQGQDYMASALFRAVREYKEQYEKGLLVHSN